MISTAYAADEFAPPPKEFKGFKWDKGALQRALDRVKSTTRLDYKACMGGAPAQLIAATDGFLRLKGR